MDGRFAATVLSIFDLERAEAAPGLAGDTGDVVKPNLGGSSSPRCVHVAILGLSPCTSHTLGKCLEAGDFRTKRTAVPGGCWEGTSQLGEGSSRDGVLGRESPEDFAVHPSEIGGCLPQSSGV